MNIERLKNHESHQFIELVWLTPIHVGSFSKTEVDQNKRNRYIKIDVSLELQMFCPYKIDSAAELLLFSRKAIKLAN